MDAFFDRSAERVIGEETADEAHARFVNAIRRVEASTPAETTIVVAHGTVISLLVGRANRVSPKVVWRDLDFTSFVVVSMPLFEIRAVVHPARG